MRCYNCVYWEDSFGCVSSANGQWSYWSSWSRCSVTCGEGTRRRVRRCDNPAPSDDGRPCVGADADTKACIARDCPSTSNTLSVSAAAAAAALHKPPYVYVRQECYVFALMCLSVRLKQDNSERCRRVLMKFLEGEGCVTSNS